MADEAGLQALKRLKGAAATHRGTVSVPGQSIAAATVVGIPLTISGVMTRDNVRLEPPSTLAAGLFKSHESVTGTGAVTLYLGNVTAAPVTLVTADWRFSVTRPL